MRFYDISPEISEKTAVFPGDQTFQREISMAFSKGDHLELSSIRTTLHIGAHCDAPSHYSADGSTIENRNLEFYYGPCQVISTETPIGKRIKLEDLRATVAAPRVLFKTGSFPNPNSWTSEFTSLSPELIEDLAQKKVRLVGIDTPSVDPANSKKLESHQAIFRSDLAVLEGIVLDKVPDGFYTLVAFPLKIKGADASPVRAVLIEGSQS